MAKEPISLFPAGVLLIHCAHWGQRDDTDWESSHFNLQLRDERRGLGRSASPQETRAQCGKFPHPPDHLLQEGKRGGYSGPIMRVAGAWLVIDKRLKLPWRGGWVDKL